MKFQIDPRPIRLRHAQHYIVITAQAEEQYLAGGDDVVAGLVLFDRERANLDAARRWLQTLTHDAKIDELLLADATATAYIGDLRYGKQRERIPQLEAALAATQRLGRRQAQGGLLGNLGLAYADMGNARRAIDFYQQTLLVVREIGDRRGEGTAFGNLGLSYAALGDMHRAINFYEQALAAAREIGDRRGEGAILGNLGIAYKNLGDARRAINFYQEQLVIVRQIGDRRGEGNALGNLGSAYLALGDMHRAIDLYQQHLLVAREIGDQHGEGATLGNLGIAYKNLGDARRAINFYQEQLVIVRQIGDRRGEGNALGNLGSAYATLCDTPRATDLYQQSLEMLHEIGDQQGAAETMWNYGQLLVKQGETEQGLLQLEQSLNFHQHIGHSSATMIAEMITYVRTHDALPEELAASVEIPADHPAAIRRGLKALENTLLETELEAQPEEARDYVRSQNMAAVLRVWKPLLHAIVAIANGDDAPRAEIEALLPQLEQDGLQLSAGLQRIWAGERNGETLTDGIDARSALLMRHVLELIVASDQEP